jgi:hypothetical protein
MYAVTFVPDATGKDGAFSVVETEQLQHEHMKAFLAYLRGDKNNALCHRAELVLFISRDYETASGMCTAFQNMLRG